MIEIVHASYAVPLERVVCAHGRDAGWSLAASIAAHVDDGSPCDRTGLDAVDTEMADRRSLAEAVHRLFFSVP
jgi:hypothetical protein